MKKQMGFLVAICLTILAGCATMEDARGGKGTGRYRVFPAAYDQVWESIPPSISHTNLKIVAREYQSGRILLERPTGAWTAGEFVAIFVDQVDAGHTRVEVVSRKRMATNVSAMNWEGPILYWLAERLDVKPYEAH